MPRAARLNKAAWLLFASSVIAATAAAGPETPATDLLGDPLPDGAVARLGTTRLRTGDMIRSLRFLPDGKTILSADWYGVRVWDAATGWLVRRFGDPHGRQFQDGAFSPDGSLAALAMSEGEIAIWDSRTGELLRSFHVGRFPGMVFSPDGKTLAIRDSTAAGVETLRLWDATSGTELRELPGPFVRLLQVSFSQDGKTLITSEDDQTVRFWDAATAKETRKLSGTAPVVETALSPDGRTLALVYAKKYEYKEANGSTTTWRAEPEARLWDVATGKETHRLKGAGEVGISALSFAPDGQTLWVSDYQTVRPWDVRTGEPAAKPLDAAHVNVIAFTPDGKTLATCGTDQVIRLWDVKAGREKAPTAGHQGRIYAAAIAPDGRTIATAGSDETIRLWDRATGRERSQIVRRGRNISALAFTPDGCGLLTTDFPPSDEAVRMWDAATGKQLRSFAGVSAVSTPDGRLLVTAAKDGIVHFWEPATGKELRHWATTKEYLKLTHIAPDGRTLISWGKDQVIRIWDAEGKELRRFDGPRFEEDSLHRIYTTAASPDGRLLAFGGQVNYQAIYDAAAGKEVRRFGDLPGPTSGLAFSADSRFLAASDWKDGTICLWELASGRSFQKWSGRQGRIIALAFAPDGSALISGGDDTTALVWDLTGRPTPGKALSSAELEACWSDLAGADAAHAQRAVRTLAAAPAQSVSYLDKRLSPVLPADERRTARLIADLDAEDFDVREKASAELAKLGEAAAAACRRTLAGEPSAEVRRRLETLLKGRDEAWSGGSPENLRLLRTLEALEFSGSPEAKAVLQRLAQGAPSARLTEEAKAALGRLSSY